MDDIYKDIEEYSEYMMDHILYQIFKTILSISSKNMKQFGQFGEMVECSFMN